MSRLLLFLSLLLVALAQVAGGALLGQADGPGLACCVFGEEGAAQDDKTGRQRVVEWLLRAPEPEFSWVAGLCAVLNYAPPEKVDGWLIGYAQEALEHPEEGAIVPRQRLAVASLYALGAAARRNGIPVILQAAFCAQAHLRRAGVYALMLTGGPDVVTHAKAVLGNRKLFDADTRRVVYKGLLEHFEPGDLYVCWQPDTDLLGIVEYLKEVRDASGDPLDREEATNTLARIALGQRWGPDMRPLEGPVAKTANPVQSPSGPAIPWLWFLLGAATGAIVVVLPYLAWTSRTRKRSEG